MLTEEDNNPFLSTSPTHSYVTTLIPRQETISWKIENVSTLLKTQAWTAMSIPVEVGLGAVEVTSWNISLQTRNNNTVLCARTMLLSPQEQHRRVTHHLKVAVERGHDAGEDEGPVYYFPAPPTTTPAERSNTTNNRNDNNPTSSNSSNRNNANITNHSTTNNTSGGSRGGNGGNTRCNAMRRMLRRFFVKNAKLDGDQCDDELIGDGSLTKEARPAHKAPLSLWKVVPIDKIRPGKDDCIELRVTLTVFGCDLHEEERH